MGIKIRRMNKKMRQIGFRVSDREWAKLEDVQNNIAIMSRGQKPDITEIVRALIGFGNPDLVSLEEREYLAGKRTSIHGPGAKNNRDKA